jgi:DNA-binding SARP family transcriptional activator/streptogramin lyase
VSTQATVHTRYVFRILGELEVRADGKPVDTLTPGQRRLLGTLLLHANTPVPREELARALWPDDPIATALRRLTGQVTGLRRRFARPGGAHLVESVPDGYLLSVEADELDAVRFRRLSQEGRQALASGDAEAAAQLLRHALDLWRGPVLGDELAEPAAHEARRLEGLRATAAAALADAELAMACAHEQAMAEQETVRETGEEAGEALAGVAAFLPVAAREQQDEVPENDLPAVPPAAATATSERPAWRRPGVLLIGAGLACAAAAVVAAALLLLREGSAAAPTAAPRLLAAIAVDPNTVVQLDPVSGNVLASFAVGLDPDRVAIAGGAVWVLGSGSGTVSRVDPARGEAVTVEPVRGARALAASDVEGIWVASGGRAALRRLPGGAAGDAQAVSVPGVSVLGLGGGKVWAVSPPGTAGEPDTVMLVDAASASVARRVTVGRDSQFVAYGHGAAWITSRGDDTVTRISASGDAETFEVGPGPTGVAITDEAVWVAHFWNDELWRLDPVTKEIEARIPLEQGPYDVQAGLGSVWVTSVDGRTITRVDPETNRVAATLRLSYPPYGLAIGEDVLWVSIRACGSAVHAC